MRVDKLYLVGFMGAGKTTVASALGRRIGWRIQDIDERIEARERRSISAIFVQTARLFPAAERRYPRAVPKQRGGRTAGQLVDLDNAPRCCATARGMWTCSSRDRSESRPTCRRRCRRSAPDAICTARGAAYADAHVRIDAPAVMNRLLGY